MNERIEELAEQAGLVNTWEGWVSTHQEHAEGVSDEFLERFAELVRQNYLRELKALKPVAFRKMAHGIWFYIEHKPSPPNDDYEPLYALDGEKV